MIEIQAYCPKPTQIGAHLRIVAPFWQMRKSEPDAFRISYELDCDLHRMMQADICILQRPFSNHCVERAKVAKLAECKLWIDWDDDLTSISRSNKVWQYYQFPGLQDNLDALQDMADVITVTTSRLERVYGKHPEKIRNLPNAIEDRLIPDKAPVGERKVIMWRGSDSHMQDLAQFRDAMIGFSRKHCPEWKFSFLGLDPEIPLYGLHPNSWRHIPQAQYYEMMEIMQKFASPVHIVPLFDSFFNRAKSNLAYLEASTSGSMVLAPNWEEWRRPGVMLYEDPEDFMHKLDNAVSDVAQCQKMAEEGLSYVREHHALSVVNKIRWKILSQLTH